MQLEYLDLDEWETHLPSTGTEVFHRPEALSVLDKHSAGDLQLLGGFKGDRAIALIPLFVQQRAFGRALLSPPPSMSVPRLGPITMPASPKRRKREKVNREFIETVLDQTGADASFTLFRTICSPKYGDPRPFVWNDFDVEPTFTYSLDVEGRDPDDVMSSFSKSLRREIRDAIDLDVSVKDEGMDGVQAVYEDTRTRYDEQEREFSVQWPYVRDLAAALDERCRSYIARDPDGNYLSGVTVLYSDDAAYFWQGGTRSTYDGVTVNSLVHWHIIEDIAEGEVPDNVHQYDLMGANTERLCRYKAKFGASLVPYYTVESSGPGMSVAKRAYQTLYH